MLQHFRWTNSKEENVQSSLTFKRRGCVDTGGIPFVFKVIAFAQSSLQGKRKKEEERRVTSSKAEQVSEDFPEELKVGDVTPSVTKLRKQSEELVKLRDWLSSKALFCECGFCIHTAGFCGVFFAFFFLKKTAAPPHSTVEAASEMPDSK